MAFDIDTHFCVCDYFINFIIRCQLKVIEILNNQLVLGLDLVLTNQFLLDSYLKLLDGGDCKAEFEFVFEDVASLSIELNGIWL